jgi:predicted extracellular nuclease
VSSNLTITFSEPVSVTGDWFQVQCDLRPAITPATAAVSGGPTTFTVDPDTDLYADDACVLSISASAVRDADTADPPDAMATDYAAGFATAAGACGDPAYQISAIQGAAPASAVVGKNRTVEAVVVGDMQGAESLSGFFVEEEAEDRDSDPATSEGLFVADGNPSPLDVAVGQRVRVTGRVAETEGATALTSLTRAVNCGAAETPLAAPVELPVPDSGWWEQVEGMRVTFDEALTVSENNDLASDGRLTLVSGRRPLAYTQTYAPDADGYAAFIEDLDRRTVFLDDGSDNVFPDPIIYPAPGLTAYNSVRIGDQILAGMTGIVDGRGVGYRLHPAAPPVFVKANPRVAAPADGDGNARVIFLGLDDYFTPNEGVYGTRGASNETELKRQRDKLVAALTELDAVLIAVSGRENDGADPGSALADLVAALNTATTPGAYVALAGGNAWGTGKTTVGLIYRPDRQLPVGAPAILDTGAFAQVDAQPDHAPPMAQTFEEATWGERFTIVVNQWRDRDTCSDGGADADQGDGQACGSASRSAAANDLAAWLASNPTGVADPDILVVGELNAFRMEAPIQDLRSGGFTDLVEQHLGAETTTAQWAGTMGYVDHALATGSFVGQVGQVATWSINADEPQALDYQTEDKSAAQLDSLYAPDSYRSSDHDPLIIDLSLLPDQSDLTGGYGLAWHTGQGDWRLGAAWGGADDGVLRGTGSWNDGQGEVTVSVNGPAQQIACLHAWLDYSDGATQAGALDAPNGQWDSNEKVIHGVALPPGKDQPVSFPLPAGVIDETATYNMRFRLVPATVGQSGCVETRESALAESIAPTGRADGGEVEDWVFSSGPLAVRIAYLSARSYGDTTQLTWETTDEVDAAGFDLSAAAGEDGPWQQVNTARIPAKAPGSTSGAQYAYQVRSSQGARWFRLDVVERSGLKWSFGPVPAEESAPTAVEVDSLDANVVAGNGPLLAAFGSLIAIVWFGRRRAQGVGR